MYVSMLQISFNNCKILAKLLVTILRKIYIAIFKFNSNHITFIITLTLSVCVCVYVCTPGEAGDILLVCTSWLQSKLEVHDGEAVDLLPALQWA